MSQSPSTDPAMAWEMALIARVSEYGIFRLTDAGIVATWNPGAARISGYDAAEIIGKHFSVFHAAEDRQAGVPEAMLQSAREHGHCEAEAWRLRKDGSRFWANVLVIPLSAPDGNLSGFANIVRDVTDKRLAHEAVLESERNFRLLVQGVTDYALFMLSPEGIVTNWNVGAARIKGYEADEIVGTHLRWFYTPEDAAKGLPERGLEIAAREGRFEAEGWRVRKDGSRFWANAIIDAIRDEHGELVGFAKITRDVTERKVAQEQLEKARAALLQSQKMEAIGKLTGGVAHDFNNVLQVLRGNLELLERRHRDSWSRERLEKAIEATEQGATLASQLLAFGRRQALQPAVVNLAVMLRNMNDMLRRALGEMIQVETVVSGGLWNTLVDPNHLENVVLNLAINSRDAMPRGGQLTLELSNTTLDSHYHALPDDVAEGQYVLLAITDTGTGMPPEVMEHAFEPYFSTKAEGEGTGLGLSMAYGFVKQSRGHMRIYSEVEHGTTVKIYLPRSTEEVVEPEPLPMPRVPGGSETILVVEDDKRVQSTVIEMLTELGYVVLKADDAQGAMVIIRSGARIDLLFSDVVMPGPMRSTEMAKMAVRVLPGLKVLFTSGYTQNAIVHGGRLDPGVHLLSKPYSREQLARKIRRMLAHRPGPVRPAARSAPNAGAPQVSILVVDDDAASREAVSELLSQMGYAVREAGNLECALREVSESVQILVTDIALPDGSGIELARIALQRVPTLKVIFASGTEAPPARDVGFEFASVRKPFSAEQLRDLIESARAGA
ncbi:PAS domain S-box protein [Paraburkholderia sp. BR10936]|uniref:PAS domain S-box protein n=1 Tax=Paraburkholderia sp. BR10936 TaxID=3236993 RepID=UPI0034D1C668